MGEASSSKNKVQSFKFTHQTFSSTRQLRTWSLLQSAHKSTFQLISVFLKSMIMLMLMINIDIASQKSKGQWLGARVYFFLRIDFLKVIFLSFQGLSRAISAARQVRRRHPGAERHRLQWTGHGQHRPLPLCLSGQEGRRGKREKERERYRKKGDTKKNNFSAFLQDGLPVSLSFARRSMIDMKRRGEGAKSATKTCRFMKQIFLCRLPSIKQLALPPPPPTSLPLPNLPICG